MSTMAAVDVDATIGLVPGYLRRRQSGQSASRAAGDADTEQGADTRPDPIDLPMLPDAPGSSITDELRRRIAAASAPERRGPRPIWYGLIAVALILVAGLAFPDTVLALLPDASPSP